MRTPLAVCLVLAMLPLSGALGADVELDRADIDLRDGSSLRRGAEYYFLYCVSCHSIEFMRYERIGADLKIAEEKLHERFLLPRSRPGDPVGNLLPADLAKSWLGTLPPDLSLVARARGTDWLYTYLRTFYEDKSRPFGVNNLVYPGVAMPHVLWDFQGLQRPVYAKESRGDGSAVPTIERLEQGAPGRLTASEYDRMVLDLVNFLAYVGEPVRAQRERLGVWVILFLVVLTGVAYLLKRNRWKDV